MVYSQLPFFSIDSVQIPVSPNFNETITACDLNLQTENCGISYTDIPDGIYIIKYSVEPSDIVFVEYNHLRITKALNRYNNILCRVDVADCDPPFRIKEKLDFLTTAGVNEKLDENS